MSVADTPVQNAFKGAFRGRTLGICSEIRPRERAPASVISCRTSSPPHQARSDSWARSHMTASLRLVRDTRPVPGGPRRLFDHVKLPVRDIARSRAFYERALQPFGVRVVQSSQGPGFAIDDQDFWIMEQETAAGSVHIAFAAPDRETVDAFHAEAVEAGGVDNGRPGLRPHYHSGYYAAFVLDPDGNNVEAVFHGDH